MAFPLSPIAGQLAPAIAALAAEMLTDLVRDDANPIQDYLDMVETSPVIGPALDVSVLIGLGMFGQYVHPDENIQAGVRASLEGMNGSILWSVAELLAVDPLGFACSEWGVMDTPTGWWLDRISALDPRKYTFRGNLGAVVDLKYQGEKGDILIPYDRVVHVTGRRWMSFGNPQGKARCRMAIAAWKAWRIVLTEAMIAAQRQGTGLLVGKAPSEKMVPLFEADGVTPFRDADGNPVSVPAPQALLNQLEGLENRSVLATDIANEIQILSQQTDGDIFFGLLKVLQQYMLMAFLMPETILTATGVGDSNLNSGQRGTLEQLISASLNQIKEALLEGPIRAIITYNYGEQESYGDFPEPEQSSIDALQLVDTLSRAVQTGFFPANELSIINKGLEAVGLPPMTEVVSQMGMKKSVGYWRGDDAGNG